MPGGRPTKYKKEFCDEVLPFMSQGFSITAFAGHLGVSRQTVYDWMNAHPEFLDAIKQGEAASAKWWEEALRNTVLTGQGNATAAIFGLKNRIPSEWRDKQVNEHVGKDDSELKITWQK
jgi:transposase